MNDLQAESICKHAEWFTSEDIFMRNSKAAEASEKGARREGDDGVGLLSGVEWSGVGVGASVCELANWFTAWQGGEYGRDGRGC